MNGFDIAVLVITGIFVLIGVWKGFVRMALRLGSTVAAVILSRMFGGMLGELILPAIIGSDSAIGARLPSSALDNVNRSISVTVGTLLIFVVAFIVFRLISGVIARAVTGGIKRRTLDRVLGAIFGFVIALGAIYALAFIVDIIAMTVIFIDPSSDIYDIIGSTKIFKYFF